MTVGEKTPSMKLSRIFKFREGEQGEAVKPFLDHLEDLRWVIVKMAAALGAAMLLAFASAPNWSTSSRDRSNRSIQSY